MRSNLRCVFDTNVLISALLFDQSKPAQAFFAALHAGEILVSADVILTERRAGPQEVRALCERGGSGTFPANLAARGYVDRDSGGVWACRDPKDDKFLELAVNGEANCIVSGDVDLLALSPFRGMEILTPGAFLDALSRDKADGEP